MKGQAQPLDRPPDFIPNLTIVFLIKTKRLICVYGKNKTRTVMLIRNPIDTVIIKRLTMRYPI